MKNVWNCKKNETTKQDRKCGITHMSKRVGTCVLALLLVVMTFAFTGCKTVEEEKSDVEATCQYLYATITEPAYGTVGGDWTLLNMKRAGFQTSDAYDDYYLETIETVLAENDGVLDPRKYTEYSRVILSMAAMGEDATDVAGYNLISYLMDYEAVCKQGISGPIWALIAMDAVGCEFPVTEGDAITSRDLLISYLLERELETGGWGYRPGEVDVDVTAMAISALAPYYLGENDSFVSIPQEQIVAAVDRGIQVLSDIQLEDGTYENYGQPTAESCAQVVIALCTLGIDCMEDSRFIKNETSVYEAMLKYKTGEGSFCHIMGDETNLIATDQVCSALIAYERFMNGQRALYDMAIVEQ